MLAGQMPTPVPNDPFQTELRSLIWRVVVDLYEGPQPASCRPHDPLHGFDARRRTVAALTADGVLATRAQAGRRR
jgi:hypothetical protein